MTGKEISPSDHPKHELRPVLERLVREGWILRKEGHWGRLYCVCGCLRIQVSGTPKDPGRAARRIRKEARMCPLSPDDPRRSITGSRT